MSRKAAKKHKGHAEVPAPQPAQVDAIERLLDDSRLHEAAAKAERLGQQFPDHVRLRDLRIRALASSGEAPKATLLAEAWTVSNPNSQRAWTLLYMLSADMGLGFLAYACHRRLDALGAQDATRTEEANRLIEAVRAKHAGLGDEEGLRSDRGLMFLVGERLEEAKAELAATTHSVPQTNLAATHYDLGDMPNAIAVARAAWQADEINTHAARVLARALLYSGEGEAAAAVGATLRAMQVREPDELAAQLETLDLLEEYAGARERYEAFPESGYENYRRDTVARARHAAAVAYLHLGERDRARVLWQQAVAEHAGHPLYQSNFNQRLGKNATEPAWREMMSEAFPSCVTPQLEREIDAAGGAEALLNEPALFEWELPGHSLYLGCLLRQMDPLCRALVGEALAQRVEDGDSHAETVLRQFLTYEFGEDKERIEALRSLYFSGRMPASGPVTIYLRGAQRTLDITVPKVRRRPPLPGLPEAAQGDYFDSVFASKPAQVRSALESLRQWRAHPDAGAAWPMIDHRIILLLYSLSGREAEGEALLQECLRTGQALPRTHAFAARMAIARKDLGGAEALLSGQLARAGDDDEDLAPVLIAQAEWHAARGEDDAELSARIANECLGADSVGEG